MIPILYNENETQFTSFGIGLLNDMIKCISTSGRNDMDELECEYPITGVLFNEIKENRIIFAKPDEKRRNQAFQIYKITEPINGVCTIYCEHIRYRLNYMPVAPFTATSCADAFAKLKEHSLIDNPFNFYTDKNIEKVYTIGEPKSAGNILGGTEGSILQEFQGEYEFDNWDVHLWTHRGSDTGVTLQYGKNITDFERERDMTNTVTGVLPYWKGEDTVVIGDISEVSSGNVPRKIETIDVSSDITSEETGFIPTKVQVTQAGYNALQNKSYVGVPSVNFKISFVALWQTEEYKDIAPLEKVGLCDTVKIAFDPLGVETTAKVIRTEYDVLLERYNEIEIGDKVTSLSEKIVAQSQEIENVQTRIEKTFDTITLQVVNGAKSSTITLSGEGIQTQAKEIRFTGGVVFEDNLTDNTTVISGGNIQTGRFYAHGNAGYTLIDTDTGVIEWDMGNSTLTEDGDFVSHGEWSTGIIEGNIYSASGSDVDAESYDACIEMHNTFGNVSGYVTRIYNDHIILEGDLHVLNPDYVEGGTESKYYNVNQDGAYVGSDSYENPIEYTTTGGFVRNITFTDRENVVADLVFTRKYDDVVRNLQFNTTTINGQTVLTSASWGMINPISEASWTNTNPNWYANWDTTQISYASGNRFRHTINGVST